MSLPGIDEVISTYNQSRSSDIGHAEQVLSQRHGLEPLLPVLIEAYPHIRRGEGRAAILSWLTCYARSRPPSCLGSSSAGGSRLPRARARLFILAYSLRADVLPRLALMQAHPDARTPADVAAAMDAISCGNHHFFVDRGHTGSTFWEVSCDQP